MTSAARVVLTAHAKINLALDLLGPRPDGYTEIATVFQAVGPEDRVEVELDPRRDGIRLVSRGPEPCPPEENLAYRAASLFAEDFGFAGGVTIVLEKRIPAGAGLGGGSSDAAAVLRGLDRLTGGRAGSRALAACAARLGADVPYFLTGGLAIGRGRGDEIEPLPDLPTWPVVLARAGRPLATADVYRRARAGLTPGGVASNISRFIRHLRDAPGELPPLGNALLAAAAGLEPQILTALCLLQEAGGHAGMTGSGSTVFALFGQEDAARDAAERLGRDRALNFVHFTRTLPRGRGESPAGTADD